MADLTGDAKARQNLLAFVRNLQQGGHNNKFIRSIRGRIENSLPAIERHAARRERERIADRIEAQASASLIKTNDLIEWLREGAVEDF